MLIVSTVVGILDNLSRGVLVKGRLDTAIRPIERRWNLWSNWSNMRTVLIYVGICVIIRMRVIECFSISNTEDMAVTCTLGREGATCYWGWKWGGRYPTPHWRCDWQERYLGWYQSPYLRSTNSGKIPRCQTGVVVHFRLMHASVERATIAEYRAGHISSVP